MTTPTTEALLAEYRDVYLEFGHGDTHCEWLDAHPEIFEGDTSHKREAVADAVDIFTRAVQYAKWNRHPDTVPLFWNVLHSLIEAKVTTGFPETDEFDS